MRELVIADLEQLPPHALVALGARCGRRARAWYLIAGYDPGSNDHQRSLDETIEVAEALAAGQRAGREYLEQLGRRADAAADFALSPYEEAHLGYVAASANQSAARVISRIPAMVTHWDAPKRLAAATLAVVEALSAAYSFRFAHPYVADNDPMLGYDGPAVRFADTAPFWAELRRDLALLHEAASGEGLDAVTSEFFSTRTVFELTPALVTVAGALETALIEDCRKNPSVLHTLTPRQFEALIADVLKELGFEVELTAQTRDGGRDIIAIRQGPIALGVTKYLVECKRFAPDRPVGVEIVRALHGVVHDERATKGIVVTTSHFSRPAREFIERNRWTLEGRDFSGLLEWLALYEGQRIKRFFPS